MDIKIIANSNGEKNLDDFMQHLYMKYYETKKRGFSEEEFKKELSLFTKENLDTFFRKYIDGTEIPPYNDIFQKVGMKVAYIGMAETSFGGTLRQSGGKLIVSKIRANSSCENSGISVNDEIISCMGYRMNKGMFESILYGLAVGDKIDVLISRDEIVFPVEITMNSYEQPRFKIQYADDEKNASLRNKWLE